jgi:hypothetical protein
MKELLLGAAPFLFWGKKFSATSGLAAGWRQRRFWREFLLLYLGKNIIKSKKKNT